MRILYILEGENVVRNGILISAIYRTGRTDDLRLRGLILPEAKPIIDSVQTYDLALLGECVGCILDLGKEHFGLVLFLQIGPYRSAFFDASKAIQIVAETVLKAD